MKTFAIIILAAALCLSAVSPKPQYKAVYCDNLRDATDIANGLFEQGWKLDEIKTYQDSFHNDEVILILSK